MTNPLNRISTTLEEVLLSWPRVLLMVALFLAAKIFRDPLADIDLFTRAAVGRLVELLGTAPRQDPFSYSPTKPVWYDHEWLAGRVFYEVAAAFGDGGVALLAILFSSLTILVMWDTQRALSRCSRDSVDAYARYWILIAITPLISVIWYSVVRAQVFTYLFFALFIRAFVYARFCGDFKKLLFLPPLLVIWLNAHGGFIVGLGFCGIFTAASLLERNWQRYWILIWFAVCAAATLVTPYGIGFWGFIFEAVTKRPYEITEWVPSTLCSLQGGAFYGIAVALLFGVVLACRGAIGGVAMRSLIPLEAIPFLLLSFYYGASHERLAPLFFITASAYGAPLLVLSISRIFLLLPALRAPARLCSVATLLVITVWSVIKVWVGGVSIATGNFSLRYSLYPVEAVEWLWNSGLSGKVFTHYNDGSLALWRLYPKFRISIDGRYDGVYDPYIRKLGFAGFVVDDPLQQEALKMLMPDYVLVGFSVPGICKDRDGIRERLFPGFEVLMSFGETCVLARSGLVVPNVSHGYSPVHMWKSRF